MLLIAQCRERYGWKSLGIVQAFKFQAFNLTSRIVRLGRCAHRMGPFHQDQKSATELMSWKVLEGSGHSSWLAYFVKMLINICPSQAMLTNGTSAASRNDSRNTT